MSYRWRSRRRRRRDDIVAMKRTTRIRISSHMGDAETSVIGSRFLAATDHRHTAPLLAIISLHDLSNGIMGAHIRLGKIQ
jgi:hypothetical protein